MNEKRILSELYVSLQGEGIRTGRPSIIARFPKCNLNCVWCDTQNNQTRLFTMDDFVKIVSDHPTFDIIITGGEPMLYQNYIIEMISKVRLWYKENITIETNGTKSPLTNLCALTEHNNVLWSISPKLSSSGEWNDLDVLSEFCDLKNDNKTFSDYDVQIKFVVDDKKDIEELKHILSDIDTKNVPVILQPMSREDDTLEIYSERCDWLSKHILEELKGYKNIRLGTQFHKILWGFGKKQI